MAAASNSLGLELFKKFCDERFLSDAKAQPEGERGGGFALRNRSRFCARPRILFPPARSRSLPSFLDEFHSLVQNEPEQQVDDMFSRLEAGEVLSKIQSVSISKGVFNLKIRYFYTSHRYIHTHARH